MMLVVALTDAFFNTQRMYIARYTCRG